MLHSIFIFSMSKGCFGAICKFWFETLSFGDIVFMSFTSFFHPILINFTALLCSEDQFTHPISVPFDHPHSLFCWQLCLSCCPLCNANVCCVCYLSLMFLLFASLGSNFLFCWLYISTSPGFALFVLASFSKFPILLTLSSFTQLLHRSSTCRTRLTLVRFCLDLRSMCITLVPLLSSLMLSCRCVYFRHSCCLVNCHFMCTRALGFWTVIAL